VGVQKVDDVGNFFFSTKKGLRQGGPLSPILFNLVADMLAVLISRARERRQIGVVPHLVEGGPSILQFADDTIIFLQDNIEQAKNLKVVLCAFKKLSRLKINFHKSELFYLGEAQEKTETYIQFFGCKEGSVPFKYLGIPMSHHKLENNDWRHIEEMFKKD